MNSKIKGLLLILLLFLFSCSDEPTTPSGDFLVSGKVLSKGFPVENALVKLDKSEIFKTATDKDGNFKLLNVPKGNYDLTISKITANASFSERTNYITVDGDLNLNNLILPKGITVYDPEDITAKTVEIIWSATDAPDFREYKVYQHSTSGLDETTGTLIHVSTSIDDTSFTVKDLNPLTDYYFRVYVMNDFGRLGGSNIIQLQTKNVELIRNGSFEELVIDKPSDWILVSPNEGKLSVDKESSYEGNNSLKFYHAAESGCWETWTTQKTSNSLLVPGARYKFSMNFKADFIDDIWFRIILRNPTIDLWLDVPVSITNTDEWSQISYEFALPENIGNNDIDMMIHFCIEGIRTWWVDNVSLMKISTSE